jgi:hypothetical protein
VIYLVLVCAFSWSLPKVMPYLRKLF